MGGAQMEHHGSGAVLGANETKILQRHRTFALPQYFTVHVSPPVASIQPRSVKDSQLPQSKIRLVVPEQETR